MLLQILLLEVLHLLELVLELIGFLPILLMAGMGDVIIN
ncbi:Uncharacterised protein [Mycobacterium tuberculosis]|nr:hypothetical protein CGSSp14BS69_08710 [Streptococcus pneumoniae SP14-BS69]ETE25088.1 hypothetical protein U755_07985 [Streptococcus pneumoniae 1719]CEY18869.1 Uncharacterised protein [Streptococcus pneumoniae]CKV84154.1 Uncharacterised protein [Mycobacterium tuberculosis]